MRPLNLRRYWNKTSAVGALMIIGGLGLYWHNPGQVQGAAHWIVMGLLAICGRDAFGKLLLLLAALADEGKAVKLNETSSATVVAKSDHIEQ